MRILEMVGTQITGRRDGAVGALQRRGVRAAGRRGVAGGGGLNVDDQCGRSRGGWSRRCKAGDGELHGAVRRPWSHRAAGGLERKKESEATG